MSKYGTIINGTLHPAPRAFMLHGAMVTNPKAEHFAALNVERAKQGLPPCLPIVDEPPPPPRTWTPLSIKRACGVRWETLKSALQANGIYEDFVMAQEVRENDEAFERGRAWAVAQFGEEIVEAVLAAAAEGN